MNVLSGLKPEKVFNFFEEISAIPRGSKHEEKISEFLVKFGKSRGLETIQDDALNVIIKKDATPGYEGIPAIIIQGHMDMVWEKNLDTEFEKTVRDLGNFLCKTATIIKRPDRNTNVIGAGKNEPLSRHVTLTQADEEFILEQIGVTMNRLGY